MNRTSDKVLSLQGAGLQGLYWMAFCPIYSFASVYLLSKNFANQQIGWILAIGNILAVILQPSIGSFADRTTKFSLKTIIGSIVLLALTLLAGLIFLHIGWLGMAVFYCSIIALLLTLQPLVNALIFEYINAGHDVNFGATRAIGSLSFAVLSSFLGIWVNRTSPNILPIVCAVLVICFLSLVLSFPKLDMLKRSRQKITPPAIQKGLQVNTGFLRKYDRFIPFVIGIACLFIFHTVINVYMVQILTPLGGKDSDLGISLMIAALCELPAFFGFSRLVTRFNTRTLLKVAGIFYALRSLIYFFAASVWMVYLGQAIQGITYAVYIPASVYYINQIMNEEDKVKGQTLITGATTLGNVFGSVVGGWLLDRFNVHAMLIFGVVAAVSGCLFMLYSVRKDTLPKTAAVQP